MDAGWSEHQRPFGPRIRGANLEQLLLEHLPSSPILNPQAFCNISIYLYLRDFKKICAFCGQNFLIFQTPLCATFYPCLEVRLAQVKISGIVQGVKDRIGLKSSDVDQGLKICIHGQFHILNWFRRVEVLRNQQKAVKYLKYIVNYEKTGIWVFPFKNCIRVHSWTLYP